MIFNLILISSFIFAYTIVIVCIVKGDSKIDKIKQDSKPTYKKFSKRI